MTPLDLIIPLQTTLIPTLPSSTRDLGSHKPFPNELPTIDGFHDEIDVMSSLQRPKKITVFGSNKKEYIFLCKPKDDLRKDCRLMEFNSMINKLLKKDPETRRRQLYIRTYAVVPLNEECGIIEWVNNTIGFRHILNSIYRAKNILTPVSELKEIYERPTPSPQKKFTDLLLPRFPDVFHEWFLENFPDPGKWFSSRLCYSRTTAVMSMVGYILGLGDRHGENILFDDTNGDCVHVDFNCLFEKGLTFDKPEKVPFRLTHNMVDAFGVTKIEGVFRKCCEESLRVLRENRESLMSVLETFIHDPLCEWNKKRASEKSGEIENELALKNLMTIERKLQGIQFQNTNMPLSVEGQVHELIKQATSIDNLSVMYIGWAAYM
jgi:serine/threonine-protein kinase ATR